MYQDQLEAILRPTPPYGEGCHQARELRATDDEAARVLTIEAQRLHSRIARHTMRGKSARTAPDRALETAAAFIDIAYLLDADEYACAQAICRRAFPEPISTPVLSDGGLAELHIALYDAARRAKVLFARQMTMH